MEGIFLGLVIVVFSITWLLTVRHVSRKNDEIVKKTASALELLTKETTQVYTELERLLKIVDSRSEEEERDRRNIERRSTDRRKGNRRSDNRRSGKDNRQDSQ
jgi:hypothetical protein